MAASSRPSGTTTDLIVLTITGASAKNPMKGTLNTNLSRLFLSRTNARKMGAIQKAKERGSVCFPKLPYMSNIVPAAPAATRPDAECLSERSSANPPKMTIDHGYSP